MAVLDDINAAIAWLEKAKTELQILDGQASTTVPVGAALPATPDSQSTSEEKIAWGSKVSPEFKKRVLWIADTLGCEPSWLMACMAWESGESFSPSKRNMAGSGATGLIQFMPNTAQKLGTTTTALAQMTAEDQLRFVYEYFKPLSGKLKNLGDVYMTILWPSGVGKSDGYVLFDRSRTPVTFRQNAGLDNNHDGSVTRGECLVKIEQKLTKGMQPGYVG